MRPFEAIAPAGVNIKDGGGPRQGGVLAQKRGYAHEQRGIGDRFTRDHVVIIVISSPVREDNVGLKQPQGVDELVAEVGPSDKKPSSWSRQT